MDLREIRDLLNYWYDHPPVHEVIFNAFFQRDGDQPARQSGKRSNAVRPSRPDDYIGIPGLNPTKSPVRKLLRFPIRIPGDQYIDKTPDSVNLNARSR